MRQPRIIKLGGSLLHTCELNACLAHIARSQSFNIIVLGGGAFADQVRLAQHRWQFNDTAAHHMAILAMQQTALLLNALQPSWPLLTTLKAMQHLHIPTAIWFPEITLLNNHALPASWQITSDSLAAWLAGQLHSRELLLIKACAINTDSLVALTHQGILDAAFLSYAQTQTYRISVMNCQSFLTYPLDSNDDREKIFV